MSHHRPDVRWLGALLLAMLVPGGATAIASDDKPSVIIRNGGPAGPATEPANCRTPVVRSALRRRLVQDLGKHRVGEAVDFFVPHLTGSISIVEQAIGTPSPTISFLGFTIENQAIPTLITEPDGTVLYDDLNYPFTPDASHLHVAAPFSAAYTGVITLPNTTQALLDSKYGYPPGRWQVTLNDFAYECALLGPQFCAGSTTDEYQLTVITKPITPTHGVLNVSIYLATDNLTAAQAVESASVARYIQTFAQLYQQAGISLGSVTFFDLPAWAKARYGILNVEFPPLPCSDFSQLFTLSQAGNDLNVFFVDSIVVQSFGQGFEVVGLDGTIPGPASFGGTIRSGAVVNMSDLNFGTCKEGEIDLINCGADVTAYISGHEGGHFLGLFHPTEAFGDFFDPLTDTPKCVCSSACLPPAQAGLCASHGVFMTNNFCSQPDSEQCGGGDNLMFWLLFPGFSKGTLSLQQGEVMRSNPAVSCAREEKRDEVGSFPCVGDDDRD